MTTWRDEWSLQSGSTLKIEGVELGILAKHALSCLDCEAIASKVPLEEWQKVTRVFGGVTGEAVYQQTKHALRSVSAHREGAKP